MSRLLVLLNKYNDSKATDAEKSQLLWMLCHSERWNEDFNDFWNQSFATMDESTDRRILKSIYKATKPKQYFPWKVLLQVAACIAILLSMVVSYHFWDENIKLTQYVDMSLEVGKGQKSDVNLPDGTKIFVNSDSRLSYGKDFNGKIRKVNFQGEAFFQVAKDVFAPFVVMIGDLEIKALGTSFNIKAYPNDNIISAFLQEGIIEVNSAKEHLSLSPGESIHYIPSTGEMYRNEKEENQSNLAWLNNEMFFDDEPLSEIIKRLERQYNVRFLIQSEKLKTITYSGTLKNSSLQSALEALIVTSPLKMGYRIVPDGIELYNK